jgi:protein ImuB
VIADSAAQEVLEALSIACLRIEADTIAALNKLGLKRVGDLISMPRAPLARRFGSHVLLRLDQALGHEEEPISPRRPVAFLSVERKLAEAIQAEEDILELASRIAQSLCSSLEARGAGGRVFELVLFRVDGRVFRIVAGASRPLRNPQRIAGLFAEKLKSVHDELDAGFGFELLRLNVLQHDPYEASQDNLLGKASGEAPLADLIDRVSARLGDDVLQAFQFRESHIPERAVFAYPALGHDARNEGRQNPAVTTGRGKATAAASKTGARGGFCRNRSGRAAEPLPLAPRSSRCRAGGRTGAYLAGMVAGPGSGAGAGLLQT